MATTGDVNITINDGQAGIVVVPASQVQVVIGCATAGTVGQIVATRSTTTLANTFTNGPLPEAAGLTVQAGGTVLAILATTATAGLIRGSNQATTAITGAAIVSTNARITYTAQTPHVLATGDIVTIASVGGATEVNGTWTITVIDTTHFEIPVTVITPYTSGGTVQYTGGRQVATGTAAMYITGTPTDDTYFQLTVTKAATVGTTGGAFTISLDANRNAGPPIALLTNTTYAVPGTGLTVHFGTGTLVVGDYVRCSTIGPMWNDAGITAALLALQNSPYASGGWGSIHIVGTSASADASTFESGSPGLDQLATGYIFTGAFCSSRDASPPAVWGGSGETEATWEAAVLLDFSTASAKRVLAGAGYYNMPSAFPTAVASTPRYRRPLAWALAAREVTIPQQRHAGRVRDGSLAQIVVDATVDPTDGFIYHDERSTPVFDYKTGGTGRFTSARTRVGQGTSDKGFFIVNPLMLAPLGSNFWMWPYRAVMDVACSITHQAASEFVNDDVLTNRNGTLSDEAANTIRGAVTRALNDNMKSVGMISSATVVVDRTNNVQVSQTVNIAVTIVARGYILQENVTIGYADPLAA